jgi:hypothetical protein
MSDDREALEYLSSVQENVIRIASPQGKYNYSYINNRAVEKVDADFVLFLNDDTSLINPTWLSQMVGWARLSGVGAVGARLLFPDGRVQHGGVALGLRKGLTAFRGLPASEAGYLCFAKITRNCSAVTAAAMLTPRSLFLELGGFDETAFAVSYNDVDYCLRLQDAGYRVVYCAEAELFHEQGYSRGRGSTSPREGLELAQRHGHRVDPYYSPHLSLDGHQFAIKPTVVPAFNPQRQLKVLFCNGALSNNGTGDSLFDLVSSLKRESAIDAQVASLKDGIMRVAYERDSISVRVLAPIRFLQALRELSEYEQWLAEVAAEAEYNNFDVVCAHETSAFWSIDAAQRRGIPSIWIIRETDSQAYFCDLPPEIATLARGCFRYPYRVVFQSSSTRSRFADLDRLDNFDVVGDSLEITRLAAPNCERPEGRRKMIAAYAALIRGAAFSSVPGRDVTDAAHQWWRLWRR